MTDGIGDQVPTVLVHSRLVSSSADWNRILRHDKIDDARPLDAAWTTRQTR